MNEVLAGYRVFVDVMRYVVFGIAVLAALIALVDWLVRRRTLNPFGPISRFFRRYIDPLMAPVERRVVRAGGQPSAAPWWTLVAVVVGGILFIELLNFLARFVTDLAFGLSSPGRLGALLISWTLSILQIALIVRVLSSWLPISPYSKWIRWAYHLTEWMLAPLRRVVPTFGPIDITPIIAFVLIALVGNLLGIR
jgi:YggT family protein